MRVGRVRASRRRGRHYASGTVGVRRAHLSITAAFLSTRIISQQQQTMRILIWNLFAIHLIRRTCERRDFFVAICFGVFMQRELVFYNLLQSKVARVCSKVVRLFLELCICTLSVCPRALGF